jgi:hypothetical protein
VFTISELSLTVPIVNTMAFLFTVLGEWYVEGKVISRGETPGPCPLYLASTNQCRNRRRYGPIVGGHWLVCSEQIVVDQSECGQANP